MPNLTSTFITTAMEDCGPVCDVSEKTLGLNYLAQLWRQGEEGSADKLSRPTMPFA